MEKWQPKMNINNRIEKWRRKSSTSLPSHKIPHVIPSSGPKLRIHSPFQTSCHKKEREKSIGLEDQQCFTCHHWISQVGSGPSVLFRRETQQPSRWSRWWRCRHLWLFVWLCRPNRSLVNYEFAQCQWLLLHWLREVIVCMRPLSRIDKLTGPGSGVSDTAH